MKYEQAKIRMAIEARERDGDVAALAKLARHLLSIVSAIDNSNQSPDNYVAEIKQRDGTFFEFAHGTRDYCIGMADGKNDDTRVVVRGGLIVVWPEEQWGEPA